MNARDERPQRRTGVFACAVLLRAVARQRAVQGGLKVRHQLAVASGRAGMHADDAGVGGDVQFGLDLGAAGLQRPQPVIDRRSRDQAIRDLVHKARRSTLRLFQLARQANRAGASLAAQALHFSVELAHGRLDHVRMQEVVLDGRQHAPLHVLARGCAGVGADGRTAFAPNRAQKAAARAAVGHGTAADAAANQAGQQAPRAARPFGAGISADLVVARANRPPQRISDDPQRRGVRADDLTGLCAASAALSGAPVLHPRMTAPDQDARVEFIVQQAVSALGVAVDGGGVPGPAARPGDALGVQTRGDGAGRPAGDVVLKHPDHDRGRVRIDLKQAGYRFALGVQLSDPAVTVGRRAPGMAALSRHSCLASARLARQFLQEQGVHGALQSHVQGLDLAFGHGVDRHAGCLEVIVDVPCVAARTGQAVQGLADHNIEGATPGGRQQGAESRTVARRRARYGRVVKLGRHGRADPFRVLAADRHLVGDRGDVLKVAGKTGV